LKHTKLRSGTTTLQRHEHILNSLVIGTGFEEVTNPYVS